MKYIGVDPGTVRSAYIITEEYEPLEWGYIDNENLKTMLTNADIVSGYQAKFIIEKPVGRAPSGKDVSETAIWTGIFIASWPEWKCVELMTRSKVRMNTPSRRKANDRTIRKELKERFSGIYPNQMDCLDIRFGGRVKFDIWQAYALVVVYLDQIGGKVWKA